MSEQPSGRITGSEMEWSITQPRSLATGTETEPLNNVLLSAVVEDYFNNHKEIGVVGHFLGNGARFYIDVGEHLEYATPEDDSYMGTVANEMAGERLVRKVTDHFVAKYNTNKLSQYIEVNKRVADESGQTWGYHQNFNVNGLSIRADVLGLYGTYAAVRNVLFGAGLLCTDGRFSLAQKALYIRESTGSGSTTSKALVNLRNEPHAYDGSSRFHDISGDPNVSPWAMFMSKATGSLVLRLIEQGITIPYLRFEDPTPAISRQVAYDTALKLGYTLINKERITALGVMETFYRYFEKLDNITDEDSRAIEQGQKVVVDMQQNPDLVTKVDWLVKRRILERFHEKHGENWNSPLMRHEDRRFDRFGPGSIGQALRETSWADDMPDEKTITERMIQPPETTRAFVRGHFVKSNNRGWGKPTHPLVVDWSRLKGPKLDEEYKLNPRQNNHPELDELYLERPAS